MSGDITVPVGPRIPRGVSEAITERREVTAPCAPSTQCAIPAPSSATSSQAATAVVAGGKAAEAVVRQSFAMTGEHILIGVIVILITVVLMLIVYIVKLRNAQPAPATPANASTSAGGGGTSAKLAIASRVESRATLPRAPVRQSEVDICAQDAAALADLVQSTFVPHGATRADETRGDGPVIEDIDDTDTRDGMPPEESAPEREQEREREPEREQERELEREPEPVREEPQMQSQAPAQPEELVPQSQPAEESMRESVRPARATRGRGRLRAAAVASDS